MSFLWLVPITVGYVGFCLLVARCLSGRVVSVERDLWLEDVDDMWDFPRGDSMDRSRDVA